MYALIASHAAPIVDTWIRVEATVSLSSRPRSISSIREVYESKNDPRASSEQRKTASHEMKACARDLDGRPWQLDRVEVTGQDHVDSLTNSARLALSASSHTHFSQHECDSPDSHETLTERFPSHVTAEQIATVVQRSPRTNIQRGMGAVGVPEVDQPREPSS